MYVLMCVCLFTKLLLTVIFTLYWCLLFCRHMRLLVPLEREHHVQCYILQMESIQEVTPALFVVQRELPFLGLWPSIRIRQRMTNCRRDLTPSESTPTASRPFVQPKRNYRSWYPARDLWPSPDDCAVISLSSWYGHYHTTLLHVL